LVEYRPAAGLEKNPPVERERRCKMISVEHLELRAKIVRSVREFFDMRGFVEVDTPVRIPAPAPEPHIDCPPAPPWFLRASPELQMKKLLCRGMRKIYQIGPCFREGEIGKRHQSEFSMLEWYRADSDYREILSDAESLVGGILGHTVPFRRITVRDAYRDLAGWDPFEEFDQDRFDFDMAEKIEPGLPKEPLFLIDYPPAAASLSKLRKGDGTPDVAERFELYVDGIELANAFTELTDPAEQRARFEAARSERRTLGEADYPLDEEFLSMLGSMPPSGGIALGIDRLVMLAARASSIGEVMAFSSAV